jgi:formate C-acetyltransferase
MNAAKTAIENECDRFIQKRNTRSSGGTVFQSLFLRGPADRLMLIGHCAKYKNFGCHGAGIANAADALAAVKKCVYEDKTIDKNTLLAALEADFEGYSKIRAMLKACPKMGNNDPYADSLGYALMDFFSKYLNNKPNGRGGIWRAGTGSAMEYLLSARKTPATADGRKAFDMFPSSFSPSLDVKTDGILSVVQSFTNYDMENIINGGPLTLEIHDTVLKNDVGIEKTARLVKLFVELGGHQLQLNSINREKLLDAQKHPEKYPGLIVRVWGWSGYFNELDLPYREHIIRRVHYSI